MQSMNLQITWKTIFIGFTGGAFLQKQITKSDISEYLVYKLDITEDNYLPFSELLSVEKNDNDFYFLLESYAKSDMSDDNLQVRKWRTVIVKEALEKLPKDDFTEGLFDLMDLWVSLGMPKDCPHIIQGRGNNLSPSEFYTMEQYLTAIENNKKWLANEIEVIIKSEQKST